MDSGAWIALLARDDALHAAARAEYDRLTAAGTGLLTTNYVIAETATRLRYDAGLPAALAFRDLMVSASRARRLRIAWVDLRAEALGWDLLAANPEIGLSLTDAITAAVARRSRIRQVFGFDADFRALGFTLVPE